MRSIKITFIFFLAALLFSACGKKDGITAEEKFDIHNLEQYYLYMISNGNSDGNRNVVLVFDFKAGNTVNYYSLLDKGMDYKYRIIDDNTISINNLYKVVFDSDGNITSVSLPPVFDEYGFTFERPALIKKRTNTSQLAGKTFSGIYYKPDRTILFPYFFYSFSADGKSVSYGHSKGITEGASKSYTPVGNIGARINFDDLSTDVVVLINDKLEVNFMENNVVYHGTFKQE